jgi:hypothetical protein
MYKLKWHKNLTIEKWNNFGTTKQLLMIANELNRAEHSARKDDEKEVINALERAFELIDLTVSVTCKKNMVRELLIFREMLALQFIKKKKSGAEINSLQKVLLSLNEEAYKVLPHSTG